ncbi:MAG: T9SS C-terminal target domain-containing protein, partial [Ignavibacteriae bacterium]
TGKYQYRLKQVDFNSNYEYFVLNSPSELVVGKPIAFEVSQNYPNPSNPNSKIDFQIPEDGKVSLKVYNLLGQEVASLVNEQKEAGYHTAIFEGTNLSSGVYFYILNVQSSNQTYSKTMKMVIIK